MARIFNAGSLSCAMLVKIALACAGVRAHSKMVARSLKNLVGEIRIVSFPDVKERGDVTDWINAGHAKDELMARCKSSPVFAEENRYQKPFNAADLETKEFAAVSMIYRRDTARGPAGIVIVFENEDRLAANKPRGQFRLPYLRTTGICRGNEPELAQRQTIFLAFRDEYWLVQRRSNQCRQLKWKLRTLGRAIDPTAIGIMLLCEVLLPLPILLLVVPLSALIRPASRIGVDVENILAALIVARMSFAGIVIVAPAIILRAGAFRHFAGAGRQVIRNQVDIVEPRDGGFR